jgi:hypothetical protein
MEIVPNPVSPLPLFQRISYAFQKIDLLLSLCQLASDG